MRFVFDTIEDPGLMSGAGHAPFLACDTCGKKIFGTDDAIVVYGLRADSSERDGSVQVIHKRTCETPATSGLPWGPVAIFMSDLLLNSKIDLGEAERNAESLAMWGLHS